MELHPLPASGTLRAVIVVQEGGWYVVFGSTEVVNEAEGGPGGEVEDVTESLTVLGLQCRPQVRQMRQS